MSKITKKRSLKIATLAITIGTTTLLGSCASVSTELSKPIKIDGSSTVYPISQEIVKELQAQATNKSIEQSDISVNFSGTGGGFKKFCAGEIEIAAASRPILSEEMQACNNAQIRYIELPIAFDALTIVVNSQNNWAQNLTIEELKKIWEPEAEDKITNWQQVRASFPDRPLQLYGPDKESGTYDYFTEAIDGARGASRQDYTASEDDEVIVNGIRNNPNAMGYLGFSYYEQHTDKLKSVAIDSGKGAIIPSRETVETAQYQPLSRPLFIYVNAQAAQDNPALQTFVEAYLEKAPEIVSKVGYIPLPEEGYRLAKIHFERGKVGTVFEGKSEFNLTIGELLRKQAKF
ncbi:PstS family phosphate ABC transporter substrate-binding protein [Candidatus Gracilibacteria bacterium]|nr:PstS family phosphate ABC transporter substrate-binding protein [Candidatus Gracilibacteria bacterium]NJM87801.1 PstS family phosphate ABC transporter substrate-binding protein [Hydrococcus sp. RU_2_2]NJP21304.1 PstS family phosphate ABC transporter substrate-binding protein [Hydrococcus sp. CRU_1_1]